MILFDKHEATHTLMGWQTQTRRLWHMKNSIKQGTQCNAYYNQPPTPFHKDNIFAIIEITNLQKWNWNGITPISPQDAFKCGFYDPDKWFTYYKHKNEKHKNRPQLQATQLPQHWIIDYRIIEPIWTLKEQICNCGDRFYSLLPNTECNTCDWIDSLDGVKGIQSL